MPLSRTSTCGSSRKRARREPGQSPVRDRAAALPPQPVTVLFTLALPLMVLYVLNGVFGQQPAGTDPGELVVYRGFDASDWYTPAYVAMAVRRASRSSLFRRTWWSTTRAACCAGSRRRGVPKATVLLSQASPAG